MSNRRKSIIGSFSVIAILSVITKVFGLVRDASISYAYGASNITDAFNIVQFLPNFLFIVIHQAIAVGFIPIFLEIRNKSKEDSENFVSTVAVILSAFSIVLCFALFAFSPFWIKLFARGFSEETASLGVEMLKYSSWALLLQSFVLVFASYLNALKKFIGPACLGFIFDLSIIGALLISKSTAHPELLGLAPLIDVGIEFVFLFFVAKKNGFKFRLKFANSLPFMKKMLAVALPSIIALGISQINYFVDKNISSNYSSGSITALSLSSNLVNAIESVVVASLATVLFTEFSKFESESKQSDAISLMKKTIERIMIFLIPISLFLFVCSGPIFKILYGRGSFTDENVLLTASCCKCYALSVPFIGLSLIISRYFYSVKKSKYVMVSSITSLLFNIVGDIFVWKFTSWGVEALASVTAISHFINCLILVLFFYFKKLKSESDFDFGMIFAIYGISFISAFFALIPISAFNLKYSGIPAVLLGFILFSLSFVLLFLVYCKKMNHEYYSLFHDFLGRIKKKRNQEIQ